MRKCSYILSTVSAMMLMITGCSIFDNSNTVKTPPPRQTLIMYMQGQSNGLESYLDGNIKQAVSAVTSTFPDSANLYIFFETSSRAPVLWRIEKPQKVGEAPRRDTVKLYPFELSSVDPATMEMIINDVLADEESPAETYGFLMSSHGAGWIPAPLKVGDPKVSGDRPPSSILQETGLVWKEQEGLPITKWMGQEGADNFMDISDIIDALDAVPVDFEYIIFDACFMSSIEALYDLRNTTKYIIASPGEIMGGGFPMHNVVPMLFDHKSPLEARMVRSAAEFHRYYTFDAPFKYGSIAAIDCSKLDELAAIVKGIYAKGLRDVDPDWIQPLELVKEGHTFHDLEDYMYSATIDRGDFNDFKAFLSNEVLMYAGHTDKLYSAFGSGGMAQHEIDPKYVCGVTVFIPRAAGDTTFPLTTAAWYETEWAKAIMP